MISVSSAPAFRRPQQVEIRRAADLIRITALRSLKVRYRGTILGVLWSFANPVLMTAVYTAIFGTAYSKYYDGSVQLYIMASFVGLVVVTFFVSATSEALTSVVGNGTLLNKLAVPPEVFPLSSVAANVFQQAVTTFPVLIVASAVTTHDPVRVLLVPFVLLTLVMLATGFGLALAALYVFFRDLPHLWSICAFMLWLTSPMFYPIQIAPAQLRPWFAINPVANQIAALREVTISTGPLQQGPLIAALLGGGITCAIGAVLFHRLRRDFMDLL
jgi:ABC-type polysaccharide/polyol phosphate export permease